MEKIAVTGMGYVGLPLALALARKFPGTVGYDCNESKIADLRKGKDRTGEHSEGEILGSGLTLTSNPRDMRGCTFFIVAVPTPVDAQKRPDLRAVIGASETVGKVLRRGSVVVYESTVYPGVTEEICGPVLERASGLRRGADFKLGYSPERINPGDREHTLERIVKVVAGEDAETLDRVAAVYSAVIPAGIHRAPSIKVAEAAKVIENTQRDLNIALMNELALIFDRMGLRTRDVLAAAATKWNFLPFKPGLVGGHCIGVDPYYLTSKAEELGYHPQVILAGRRINDGMGMFVAQKTVKLMGRNGRKIKGARVGILGVTFKENIRDVRNSRVPDIVAELKEFGAVSVVHDPMADPEEVEREYGFRTVGWKGLGRLDALILAVAHRQYLEMPVGRLLAPLKPGGVVVDVKSALDPAAVPRRFEYWCL
ncbi:MAG: nucleotide sugar dehydrogenase [Planctomycetota bacterium]|nr:nucleotide sugar dehydrogenase [Planctomycetota bacterium]